MKLEKLVPPVELCKLIPAGEFEDSVFIWDNSEQYGFWDGEDKNGNHIGGWGKLPAMGWRVRQNFSERCRKRMKESGTVLNVYPAPTLQEIMLEFNKLDAWCPTMFYLHDQWIVDYQIDTVDGMNDVVEQTDPDNPAIAAMKLWLKIKGVEVTV